MGQFPNAAESSSVWVNWQAFGIVPLMTCLCAQKQNVGNAIMLFEEIRFEKIPLWKINVRNMILCDCIYTVHVVRSLNLLTPTHAQLYFIKKTI